jgi:hypothetical protein
MFWTYTTYTTYTPKHKQSEWRPVKKLTNEEELLLEYTDPYTGEKITREMWEYAQSQLLEDKEFLVQVVLDNYDIDAAQIIKIKELCTRDFNPAEYLDRREKLVEKNLERVSRSGASKWKCTDCKITSDMFFMYQHECSESLVKNKKKKKKKKEEEEDGTVAAAKDKRNLRPHDDDGGCHYARPSWIEPNSFSISEGEAFSLSSRRWC